MYIYIYLYYIASRVLVSQRHDIIHVLALHYYHPRAGIVTSIAIKRHTLDKIR